MATTSKFIPFKTDNEHIKNGYVQNGVTPKYTNIGAVNAVRPGSASTNTTNLSLNQNLAKRAEQAGVGTNAYMPTANATSPTYLNKAYDPSSKTAQEVDWKYNAVTRDGTSYMPTADRSAYNATLPTKNGSGSGSASGGVGGGYGSGGITGYANFTPSDAYNQAMAYTNQLLEKLSSGRTSYTDQINSLMDTINNRAAFSYDPDTDKNNSLSSFIHRTSYHTKIKFMYDKCKVHVKFRSDFILNSRGKSREIVVPFES